jgi:hypothetical protein
MIKMRNIGFWKWLYTRTKEIVHAEETKTMLSIIAGVFSIALGLAFGVITTPYAFAGVPSGFLLIFYGVYKADCF